MKVTGKMDKIICEICKKEIDKSFEGYCRVTDYHLGAVSKEKFYHRTCWLSFWMDKAKEKETKSLAENVLKRASGMLDRLGAPQVI